MGISPLQLVEEILGPRLERIEDEEKNPVFKNGFIKIKILAIDQD